MAVKTRAQLKLFFETGDVPIEEEFQHVLDSYMHISESNSGSLHLSGNINVDGNITASGTGAFSELNVTLGAGTDDSVLVLNSSNNVVTDEIDTRVWGSTLVDGTSLSTHNIPQVHDSNTIKDSNMWQSNASEIGINTSWSADFPATLTVSGNISASSDLHALGNITGGANLEISKSFNIGTNIDLNHTVTGSLFTSGAIALSGSGLVNVRGNITGGGFIRSPFDLLIRSITASFDGDPGSGEISASAIILKNVTASNNISASGFVSASSFHGSISASNILQPFPNVTASGGISASTAIFHGNVTASGDISASTAILGGNITASGTISASNLYVNHVTASNITASHLSLSTITASHHISASGDGDFASVTGSEVYARENIIAAYDVSASGDIYGTDIFASGNMSASNLYVNGNITASTNISTSRGFYAEKAIIAGNITASGDITASRGIFTGILTTYNNVSSSGFLYAKSASIDGDISASGDITASGTVSASKGWFGSLNNPNMALTASTVSASSWISASAFHGPISASYIVQPFGNITASGNISASGTITASGFNVANMTLTNITASNISASNNISGSKGYFEKLWVDDNAAYTSGNLSSSIFVRGNSTDGINNYGGALILGQPDGGIVSSSGAAIVAKQTTADNNQVGLAFQVHDDNASNPREEKMILNWNNAGTAELIVIGDISASGFVKATNVTASMGVSASNIAANNLVLKNNITASGNISASSTILTGNVTASGNISASSTILTGNVTASGNISASTAIFHGNVTASGDISASNLIITNFTSSGNISASGDLTVNSITASGDILLDEDQRIYFEADKQTWIESNGANLIRIVAHNNQMLLLDSQTGNRAVFGNGTKVFIGDNNNANPISASLQVAGNIWATGSNGHITASGNISASGTNHIFGGNISASGTVSASVLKATSQVSTLGLVTGVDGGLFFGDITANGNILGDNLTNISAMNNITASGGVSASTGNFLNLANKGTVAASSLTGSFTGSFTGITTTASYVATASHALTSITASHVVTSSHALTSITASHVVTASHALTATTASHVVTASHALTATTASHVVTSSHALTSITASHVVTASFANRSTTASFALAGNLEWDGSRDGNSSITGSLTVSESNLLVIGNITASGGHLTLGSQSAIYTGSALVFHTQRGTNIFAGTNAGNVTLTGDNNVGIGRLAGNSLTSANNNTWIGFEAGKSNTVGNRNVAVGREALENNISGDGNIAIGYQAGQNETGDNMLYVGNDTNPIFLKGDMSSNTNRLTLSGKLVVTESISASGHLWASNSNASGITASVVVWDSASGKFYHTGSYGGGGGGGSADNLGNHTASVALNMAAKSIYSVGMLFLTGANSTNPGMYNVDSTTAYVLRTDRISETLSNKYIRWTTDDFTHFPQTDYRIAIGSGNYTVNANTNFYVSGNIEAAGANGNVTASGTISASGNIFGGAAISASGHLFASTSQGNFVNVVVADTASGQFYVTASNQLPSALGQTFYNTGKRAGNSEITGSLIVSGGAGLGVITASGLLITGSNVSINKGNITSSGHIRLTQTNNKTSGSILMDQQSFLHAAGEESVFLGGIAGNYQNNAQQNTGIGYNSLNSIDTGTTNTALGYNSLKEAVDATQNVAIGGSALSSQVNGTGNVAIGYQAGKSITDSSDKNIFVGWKAGDRIQASDTDENIAIGINSLSGSQANYQIAIGNVAGQANTTASKLFIGNAFENGDTGPGYGSLIEGEMNLGGQSVDDTSALKSGRVTIKQILRIFPTASSTQFSVDGGGGSAQPGDIMVSGSGVNGTRHFLKFWDGVEWRDLF